MRAGLPSAVLGGIREEEAPGGRRGSQGFGGTREEARRVLSEQGVWGRPGGHRIGPRSAPCGEGAGQGLAPCLPPSSPFGGCGSAEHGGDPPRGHGLCGHQSALPRPR